MYIYAPRKSLIVNTKKMGYARGAYPIFSLPKVNTLFPVFQIAFNYFYKTGEGEILIFAVFL